MKKLIMLSVVFLLSAAIMPVEAQIKFPQIDPPGGNITIDPPISVKTIPLYYADLIEHIKNNDYIINLDLVALYNHSAKPFTNKREPTNVGHIGGSTSLQDKGSYLQGEASGYDAKYNNSDYNINRGCSFKIKIYPESDKKKIKTVQVDFNGVSDYTSSAFYLESIDVQYHAHCITINGIHRDGTRTMAISLIIYLQTYLI